VLYFLFFIFVCGQFGPEGLAKCCAFCFFVCVGVVFYFFIFLFLCVGSLGLRASPRCCAFFFVCVVFGPSAVCATAVWA